MRLPSLFRRTPFRLTLLFLALYAATASAVLAYVYVASASEAQNRARTEVEREVQDLTALFESRGVDALNATLVDRIISGGPFLYQLMTPQGAKITGNLGISLRDPATTDEDAPVDESPIANYAGGTQWDTFRFTDTEDDGRVVSKQAYGVQTTLGGGPMLYVGRDLGDTDAYLGRLTQALWLAMGMMLVLGAGGGLILSRNVERSMARLNRVVSAVRDGDMKARARVRATGDELDELGRGINGMLDQLEASMASIRHAGDAIAHDLRTPLNRMRSRMEVALLDVEAGTTSGGDALEIALAEADHLLKTFNTVLSISRLQSSGAPDRERFEAGDLARDMAELYEPACEDKGQEFSAEIETGLVVEANRPFIAQALANIIDNAVKYTPTGGAVKLRARRRSSGEIEYSVTDTGPGVPAADRARVVERFVRLDNSRTEIGTGLGLALVSAVMEAHDGRLQLDEGPGYYDGFGPGLRVALILPPPA